MIIRETSRAAYKAVNESGLVTRTAKKVYNCFFENGSLTSAECYDLLGWKGSDQRGNIRARVHELKQMGLLVELGKRKCSITGMTVLFYRTTDSFPVKYEKPVAHKCPTCKGTGEIKTQQARLF